MTQSVSESVQQVKRSIESTKHSLAKAGPHAGESEKALIENLIAEGERFLEASEQVPVTSREEIPSKLSLQISGKRTGGILKSLGIGVVAYLMIVLVLKFLS